MTVLSDNAPNVSSARLLGATVRLKNKKRTATVLSDNIIIGNSSIEGGVFLSKRLGGFRYWNIEDIEIVAPNESSSATAESRAPQPE